MAFRRFFTVLAMGAAALATAMPAAAQSFGTSASSDRAGRWEAYAGGRLVQSGSADFSGGSSIKTEDDLGFEFGFGYNVSDHLLISGEMGWNTISYDGNLVSADAPALPSVRISGELETASIGASVTWNFLSGPITPYVTGTPDFGAFRFEVGGIF